MLLNYAESKWHLNIYLSAPKMSLALNLLKSASPTMGRYSLTRELEEIYIYSNEYPIIE